MDADDMAFARLTDEQIQLVLDSLQLEDHDESQQGGDVSTMNIDRDVVSFLLGNNSHYEEQESYDELSSDLLMSDEGDAGEGDEDIELCEGDEEEEDDEGDEEEDEEEEDEEEEEDNVSKKTR